MAYILNPRNLNRIQPAAATTARKHETKRLKLGPFASK